MASRFLRTIAKSPYRSVIQMKPWKDRDPQVAALFNPAFSGSLVYTAVSQFQKRDPRGMPFPVLFLVLPIVLSSSLRKTLPNTTRTPLQLWIDRAPEIRIDLAKRVSNLAPITRESLVFLLQRQRLSTKKDRILKGKPIIGLSAAAAGATELADLMERARVLGGILGKEIDTETIFISLGLTI
jgi:hypothetical protein